MRKFFAALTLLNRQEELEQLVKWAKQKGYLAPLHLYEIRLSDTQKALFRTQIAMPRVAVCAHIAHVSKKVLFSRPKYYQKGSACAYKRAWLTP